MKLVCEDCKTEIDPENRWINLKRFYYFASVKSLYICDKCGHCNDLDKIPVK